MTTPTHINLPALREKAKSDRVPPQIPMGDANTDGDKWPVNVAAAADEALGQAPGVTFDLANPPTMSFILRDVITAAGEDAGYSEATARELFARPVPDRPGVRFTALDDIPEQRDPDLGTQLSAAVRAARAAVEKELAEGRPAPLDLPAPAAVRPIPRAGTQALAEPVDRARQASRRTRRTWMPAMPGWVRQWLGTVEQPTTERGAA